ncbi:alpha/beta hydrolase [Paraglaciecola aestuariivivens]
MNNFSDYVSHVQRFDPHHSHEATRALEVGAPDIHFFSTKDGFQLKLKRYQAGSKGPIILSHCIGVSSLMYAIDTIDCNLLEYLVAQQYDVWLLDHRLSIELPTSSMQSSMDDVAKLDYPAAVAFVCEKTQAKAVDIFAHGVGSSTLTMALLAGLQQVNKVVCSQVSTHLYSIDLNINKAKLRAPAWLPYLGKKHLTAYTDTNAGLCNKFYDASLIFMPVPKHERCNNAVCHRISSIFGELYEHSQINSATHQALARMFGRVNLRAMKQLTEMLLANHLVDANGQNSYLPHIDKLTLPMLFLSGANNDCVLPKSTLKTQELLSASNGHAYYHRHEIPEYGHVDCVIGKNAATDVYPLVLDFLQA